MPDTPERDVAMNNKDTGEAPERIWLTPQFADAAAVIGGGIYHVNLSEEDRKGCVEYARVDPPAAPTGAAIKIILDYIAECGNAAETAAEPEKLRINYLQAAANEIFRRVSAVVTPPAPDEADKALAQQIEDFLLMPHGVELKTLLPRLQTRILAALAQARKEGALAQRETDVEICKDVQKLNEQCEIDSEDDQSKYAYACYAAGADHCAASIARRGKTRMSSEQLDWISCREQAPPEGTPVDTKIDDEKGLRNEQRMYFLNGLWWTGQGRDAMYVYYSPTHWKGTNDTTK